MSKTLDIIMSLKDHVSPNLGKINDNLQTTSGRLNVVGKSVGKLGGILKGALLGGAIAKFSMDALKAYDVQMKAEASVRRALEHTGKTAVEAQQGLKEFKDFASKQQDITAFGDEATLQIISGLISQGFGKKSIEDIVAMSQDIARSTGDEQENVTKAVAAYVKTGKGAAKLAKAYKLNNDLLGKGTNESERLSEVWKAFGESSHRGASTEFLKSFSGQLVAVQSRLDDLKEPVGELINTLLGGNSQGLSGAAGAMASIGDTIKTATEDIQTMTDRSKELGGGITGVGLACATQHPVVTAFFATLAGAKTLEMLSSVITSITNIKTAVSALGGAISITTGLASGLVGALTLLYTGAQNWLSLSPEVQASFNKTQQEANGVYQYNPIMTEGRKSWFDKNATGTTYFQGGLTSVNENGGEIMNLPNGTQIIPHDISQKMASEGNNVTVNVNVAGNVIGNQDFIDQVGDAISNRVSLALANM